MINIKKASLVGTIAVSVLLLSACNAYKSTSNGSASSSTAASSSSTTDVSAAVVTYSDNGFSPVTVNAKVGQKVVFKNTSSSGIQIQSDPHPIHNLYPQLNIGAIAAGASGSTTFAKAGTYTYHNHLNPSQKGTVVVK